MAEVLIQISVSVGGAYPVELLGEIENGARAKLAAGSIPAGAIDLQADILAGKTPAVGLSAAGAALYKVLFDALGEPLRRLLDGPEVTLLLDIEPNELQRVPWEILEWPKSIAAGVAPARIAEAHHLARVYRPDWRLASPPSGGPLRMLIVVGATPEDEDVEPWPEIDEIKRQLYPVHRTLDFEIIDSYPDLYPAILRFRPHILHFIGHGSSEPPALEFAKRDPVPAWSWGANRIVTDVGRTALEDWRPSLVFLNACRTGRAAGDLGPLAGAFLEAGARATIAMQGNIKGLAAGRLAGTFYQGIAAGLSIEQALTKARGEVARLDGILEASYAALTLRCHPSCIFPSFATRISDYKARAKSCPLLPKLSFFVNQLKPRRQLCGRLWPFQAGELRNNFVLIRGESGFGKTLLSTWLLDLSASLGHLVRYVKIGGVAGGVDFVKILELIWGGLNPAPANRSPLFDALPLDPEPLRQLLHTSKDPVLLYATFRQALSGLAKAQPITLVLDGFDRNMDEGSFWALWEHLFLHLSGSDLSSVTLIMALSRDDYDFYRIDSTLAQRWELMLNKDEVPLEALSKEEFAKLLVEYMYHRSPRLHNILPKIEELLLDSGYPAPLSIASLEKKTDQLASFLEIPLEPLPGVTTGIV